VKATGNGYLWVFDNTQKNTALIYPQNCGADCGNAITAGHEIYLPDQLKRGLFAGTGRGQETLLFLVTSLPERENAVRIASRFGPNPVVKASGGTVSENWGFDSVTYKIQ
jgi:hypothetical protein